MHMTNESLQEAKRHLDQLYNYPDMSLLSSGYPELDQLTGGLVRGGLTVVAGRPAMGRTCMLLNMVSRLSRQIRGTILVITPYRSDREFTDAYLKISTGIPNLLDCSTPNAEVARRCSEYFMEKTAKVRFAFCFDLEDIYETCYRQEDLQLVMVVSPENICKSAYWFEVPMRRLPYAEPLSKSLEALRELAQQMDVPVVTTVCLRRRLETRKDKRPKLTDLKVIDVSPEQIDQLIFLYRDSYYDPDAEQVAEWIVAKTPYGQAGTVKLAWDYPTCRYETLK